MQINNSRNFSPQFKAIKVANCYNYAHGKTSIDVFKLTSKDKSFLEKLSRKISIRKLCPQLMNDVQDRWQRVFNYCIQEAKNADNRTYIALSEGKPCAILTYHEETSKNNYLDGVSTIPTTEDGKVPLAGETLIYQLFRDSFEDKIHRGILLEAIHNGPIDVVKKYKRFGFTTISANEDYTLMSCNKYKVAEQIDNFKRKFTYESSEPEEINLENCID